jgi:hypothetical protein
VASALLVLMVLAVLAAGGWREASYHAAIRATARTSLLLFLTAFIASGARRLFPSVLTAWLVQNRRYVGLSFAASHFLHLGVILAVAARWPKGSVVEARLVDVAPGATVYLFVLAMAVTSSDRAVAFLGPRRWRMLHTVGAYLIWLAFVAAYVPRAIAEPAYAPAAALLVAALVVRLARRRRAPLVPQGE